MKNRVVLFCLCLVGMLWAERAFAENLCSPAPLPPKEERTDEFWKKYLKENLVSCYGRVHPQIEYAAIGIADGWLSRVDCSFVVPCVIVIARQFLDSAESPKEVLFTLGHEAGHIAILFGRDFKLLPDTELEFGADLFAIQPIPLGACYGASVLSWTLQRILEMADLTEADKQATIHVAQRRIANMKTYCVVEVAFENTELRK